MSKESNQLKDEIFKENQKSLNCFWNCLTIFLHLCLFDFDFFKFNKFSNLLFWILDRRMLFVQLVGVPSFWETFGRGIQQYCRPRWTSAPGSLFSSVSEISVLAIVGVEGVEFPVAGEKAVEFRVVEFGGAPGIAVPGMWVLVADIVVVAAISRQL